MKILGPASRTDLTDVQYGSVARALELQLRGRDGGSNGTVWPRRRPLLASRSQKHPYRRCSSHVARRTVETTPTPCPQQYSVDHVGDSESRDRQCQTHTSCVDTTPTCTRADALFFSCAPHSAQLTALCQCGHTAVGGKDFPNFEMLDAKIASALNKIIQTSHFKKKVRLEEQKAQKQDRFQRGKTDRLHDLRQLSSDWRS